MMDCPGNVATPILSNLVLGCVNFLISATVQENNSVE